jgi:hypothetical protein
LGGEDGGVGFAGVRGEGGGGGLGRVQALEVYLDFSVCEVLDQLLLLDLLVDDGSVVLDREFGVVVDVQFEVDMCFLYFDYLFLVIELLQKWMFQYLFNCNPFPRFKLQSSGYKIQQFLIIRS